MDSLKERIRELRKSLNLSQTEFGARIGVKQGSVAGYESGKREPIDAVIYSICREFGVDEGWLRAGEGEPFLQLSEDEEFLRIMAEIQVSDDDFIKGLLRSYWNLDDKGKAVIRNLIDGISDK